MPMAVDRNRARNYGGIYVGTATPSEYNAAHGVFCSADQLAEAAAACSVQSACCPPSVKEQRNQFKSIVTETQSRLSIKELAASTRPIRRHEILEAGQLLLRPQGTSVHLPVAMPTLLPPCQTRPVRDC